MFLDGGAHAGGVAAVHQHRRFAVDGVAAAAVVGDDSFAVVQLQAVWRFLPAAVFDVVLDDHTIAAVGQDADKLRTHGHVNAGRRGLCEGLCRQHQSGGG